MCIIMVGKFYYEVKYRVLCLKRCHLPAAYVYSNRMCENVQVCLVLDPTFVCVILPLTLRLYYMYVLCRVRVGHILQFDCLLFQFGSLSISGFKYVSSLSSESHGHSLHFNGRHRFRSIYILFDLLVLGDFQFIRSERYPNVCVLQ